jgi:transcription elongation factor Elf1
MEIEHFFTCPSCWQKISVVLDLSIAGQAYIEDCEVCCRPMRIAYAANDFELVDFEAETLE